jgi:hypothetical protein
MFRFTRFWARLLSICGLAMIAASLVGAVLVLLDPALAGFPGGATGGPGHVVRGALAIAVAAVGFLIGGSLLVAAQLLQLLLKMGRLLRRIDARMRSWEGKLGQLFEEQPAVRKRGRPGL